MNPQLEAQRRCPVEGPAERSCGLRRRFTAQREVELERKELFYHTQPPKRIDPLLSSFNDCRRRHHVCRELHETNAVQLPGAPPGHQ